MGGLYSCFDFRLSSEIPLRELTVADDPDDLRPIVNVRVGAVPELLAGAGLAKYGVQAAGEDALLTVAGTGRYLVRGGREIMVDAEDGAADRMVRLFLLGSALGILCHQRGMLPLHANAVVAGGGAYAFAGTSGAGKSTLAAWFSRAGHPVLCDDVCVVGRDSQGGPVTWPGLPRLKLWGEAAAVFEHDTEGLDPAIEGMDKYHVPLPAPAHSGPFPLRRLYLLRRSEGGAEGTIVRLRGPAAMEAVMAQTYRAAYLGPMGLTARHFHQAADLAGRIEVYAATRAWGYDVFDREAGRLERHIAGQG